MSTVSHLGIAQHAMSSTFELQRRTGAGETFDNLANPTVPWMVALVCIILFAIMLATLWPNESETSPYQRQRKFARVDNLFFKVYGHILGDEEGRRLLRLLRIGERPLLVREDTPEQLTLLGLSFGGCSLVGNLRLRRGAVVLLQLDSLPDFPVKSLTVAAKVVWVRSQRERGKVMEVAGLKFISFSDAGNTQSLRQYLNYLLDEPLG